MNITVAGRHVAITEAIKAYAEKKVSKLERIFERIIRVQINLDVEAERHVAEIIISAPKGSMFISEVTNHDIYVAIDRAVDKLERQLTKHKEKLQERGRAAKRRLPPLPPEAVEP